MTYSRQVQLSYQQHLSTWNDKLLVLVLDESERKENKICEYNETTFWFSFDSIDVLCRTIGIDKNDTKIMNGLDTMKLVLSNDNHLVFAWIRDIKLLTIESCTYKTSHESKSVQPNNENGD